MGNQYDNLIAGDFPLEAVEVTVLSGANLAKGSVIGKITASGKCILSLSTAGDGSQVPYAVLTKDVDASAGDVIGSAYVTGSINENALVLGAAHTADTIRDGFRALGIILRANRAE